MKKGFTLIELLIVIGILAILATTVVLVLNPAQILAETRDTQRISDLQTVVSAIALTQNTDATSGFCTGAATPFPACLATSPGPTCTAGTCNPFIGGSCQTVTTPTACTTSNARGVDGSGWVGFNFRGTAPNPNPSISALPVDPSNDGCTLGTPPAPTTASRCYAFKYQSTDRTFELDTILESTKHAGKMTTDGGNNPNFYELGTNVGL